MTSEKGNKKQSKFRTVFDRLKIKKRLVLINETTFEEQKHYSFTPLNIFTISVFVLFVIITITYLIIAFTPIKHTIPGYPDAREVERIKQLEIENAKFLEEEKHKVDVENLYYSNLLAILNNQTPIDPTISNDSVTQSVEEGVEDSLSSNRPKEDSILREEIDKREKYQLNDIPNEFSSSSSESLTGVYFFTPLRGTVSNELDISKGHFGVDIAAEKDEAVKAVLDGEIIFSDWSPEQGHMVIIQHKQNILSVYKHNSFLLKKTGDFVKAGDAIAIVGSTGTTSTGTHLHFELWYNGKCLNPLDFISF